MGLAQSLRELPRFESQAIASSSLTLPHGTPARISFTMSVCSSILKTSTRTSAILTLTIYQMRFKSRHKAWIEPTQISSLCLRRIEQTRSSGELRRSAACIVRDASCELGYGRSGDFSDLTVRRPSFCHYAKRRPARQSDRRARLATREKMHVSGRYAGSFGLQKSLPADHNDHRATMVRSRASEMPGCYPRPGARSPSR